MPLGPGAMATLIDAGVDGVISDWPDGLRQVAAAKGQPLPQQTAVAP
jgi:hypothetical protein